MSEREIVLPGLVDMHVHLREPGYTEAEDFTSGTEAALVGGVVAMLDMPNNKNHPIRTQQDLEQKIGLARESIRSDVGFYFGANPNEELEIGGSEYQQLVETFERVGDQVFGLKLYCDVTTGSEHKHGADAFRPVVMAWLEANPTHLVIAHTEGRQAVSEMIDLVARERGGRIHIPHISKQDELEEVMNAKQDDNINDRVSTGACPHHLFLTEEDSVRLGWYGRMKPTLGTTADRNFLRENITMIDVIETDHAPHTIEDKERAQQTNREGDISSGKATCFGVPGLEAMLPLLLRGEQEGWITREQIIQKTFVNPTALLGLELPDSEVYVDLTPRTFTKEDVRSKCEWSPYEGMEVAGRVGTVVVGGVVQMHDGVVTARAGDGTVLMPQGRRK